MSNSPAARLSALADRYWRFECHEIPLSAALAGEELPDAVVFRESLADHDRRAAGAAALRRELSTVDADVLAPQDAATHRLMARELDGLVDQHAVDSHLRPWLLPGGPEFNAVFWANGTTVADARAGARYVERLAGLPAYLRDVQDRVETGHAKGYRYPRAVLVGAAANARANVGGDEVDASVWLGPFRRSPAAGRDDVAVQAARAHAVVRESLQPALAAWADALDGWARGCSRAGMGCADGPAGAEYYRVWVRWFTTTGIDPAEVHALGRAEVERIGAEIDAVAADAGHPRDLAGYRRRLASGAFVAASKEALRERVEVICKRIDARIPAFFARIPRSTYGVEVMPEALSARMPPAYAQPAPGDGAAAGLFWVSGLPAKCPTYLHPALVVHEAWPGHLMHIALMSEQTGLPAFRRHGAVKVTAFVEGWALYCEWLGIAMGVYTTPHEHYGRLEMELWRAVRLVVDTGLHLHGWSREQAVEYMAARLTLSTETIEGEVDRYAAMPGQALAYQVGHLKLRELRRRAEARLGPRFDVRRFHGVVTTAGAVTLPVLEELVDHWLKGQADGA